MSTELARACQNADRCCAQERWASPSPSGTLTGFGPNDDRWAPHSRPNLRHIDAAFEEIRREQIETSYILKQFAFAGVRVFEYQGGGRELTLDGPMAKLDMAVHNFAAELERLKASQRTRDALHCKAEKGYVVGGTVFGYDNVPILGESGKRQHVERRIDGEEAAIVVRIFEAVAAGTGFKKLAKTFNAEALPSPPDVREVRTWQFCDSQSGANIACLCRMAAPMLVNLCAHSQWQDDWAASRLVPILEWLDAQEHLDAMGRASSMGYVERKREASALQTSSPNLIGAANEVWTA
ncbi:MAG: hypothetical protein ACREKS_03115 [Candidatus Rokuibacteriota bacterium]